jgi:thiol-disulfide isomerase/thioredoxin
VAHLRVYQQSTLVRKSDTPSIATNGWNTLQFSLSPEDIAESTFELSEHGLGDVGDVPAAGGTDYQFRLSEFVPEKFRKSALVGSAHFAGVVRDDSAKLAANADYTPNDVLDRLNASRKAVSNATFDSVWKTFDDGSKSPDGKTRGSTRWERQTFYWDDLGRRRIMAHGGPVSQDGRMLEEEDPGLSDEYFTGEITVSGGFHPKWDRQGGKPASPKDARNAEGYRNVIISDAASGLRRGLESIRNPLEYMHIVAANTIGVAVQRGDGTVRGAKDGRLAVDITHTDPDSPYARTVVIVMPEQNWPVESLRSYMGDGNLAREIVCDYKKQEDGLWVPIRLRHTHWGERKQGDLPYWIWSCEVTKGILNDPSFDQHVFDLRLKPDTWVSDTRYKVSYRIGRKEAVASDLDRYAAEARKAEEDDQKLLKEQEYVKALVRPIEGMIGKPAPALPAGTWIGGSCPSLAGRPYLLHFWGTRCGPCKSDFPRLKTLAERGAIIIGVHTSGTSSNDVEKVVREYHLNYPTFLASDNNPDGRSPRVGAYPAGIAPYCILVDAQGRVNGHGFLSEVNVEALFSTRKDKVSPLWPNP